MGFNFSESCPLGTCFDLNPGTTSYVLVIATNATSYDSNGNSTFTFEADGAFPGYFEPAGTPLGTPVPAALPLFATGLGGLGLLGWRRKRKAQGV